VNETAAPPAVVLFDIDGTLITTGGAGGRAWDRAFRTLHGREADITRFSESGMTDPVVGRVVFRGVMEREPTQTELAQLIMGYLMELPIEVEKSPGYRRMPGVVKTLEHLARGGTVLGLVTGNIEGAARIKIDRAHLNPYFAFGGYGTDSADRAELTSAAIDRAATMHGHELDRRSVFVVGDTPRDVDAAKAVGAVSVAVATGEYTVDQLTETGADHVLGSMETLFPGMEPEAP
jgi:phosphoglycolate phosphatase-like HAD superfamily hydrolase